MSAVYDISRHLPEKNRKVNRERYVENVMKMLSRTEEEILGVWGESELSDRRLQEAYEDAAGKLDITIATYELRNPGIRELAKKGMITVKKTPVREKIHITVYDKNAYVSEYHPDDKIKKAVVREEDPAGIIAHRNMIYKVHENSPLVLPEDVDHAFPISISEEEDNYWHKPKWILKGEKIFRKHTDELLREHGEGDAVIIDVENEGIVAVSEDSVEAVKEAFKRTGYRLGEKVFYERKL